MSEEAKRLAEVKEYLERRLEELRREETLLEEALRLVNQALSSTSFMRASELLQRTPQATAAEARPAATAGAKAGGTPLEEALITSATTGEQLAKVIVYPESIEIVFTKEFSAGTPPFESFFVRKVLEGYKRKDEDLVARGEKLPDEVFEYEIVEDKGLLRKIIIRNYGDKRVANEIKSTLRWTLNKMLARSGQE
ncbi:hypothetical protein [Infirmifilum sp. NZ]|uniref:hypothetical protein n=1 Tax=Infirmifilum sp. NZ TaxID=2926850 RepID=UPI0027A7A094|nr:hypothetical protein [Infirmifilum sp. NZ]UNQ72808.1 hypothetical protein MOV14_06745 [Infirmifilum sp. NZ]